MKSDCVNLCRTTWLSLTGKWPSPPPSLSSTSSPPSYRHSINLTMPHSPEQIALLCLLFLYFCTCTEATIANSTLITFTININSLKDFTKYTTAWLISFLAITLHCHIDEILMQLWKRTLLILLWKGFLPPIPETSSHSRRPPSHSPLPWQVANNSHWSHWSAAASLRVNLVTLIRRCRGGTNCRLSDHGLGHGHGHGHWPLVRAKIVQNCSLKTIEIKRCMIWCLIGVRSVLQDIDKSFNSFEPLTGVCWRPSSFWKAFLFQMGLPISACTS